MGSLSLDLSHLIILKNHHRLESPTRSLLVNAGQDIFLQAGTGNIEATCLNDIRLHSVAGSVSINAHAQELINICFICSDFEFRN